MSDLSLLPVPLLFFFFISIAAQSNSSDFPSCPSYTCGEINISYPFWRMDNEPTSTHLCGYEGFGINCEGGNRPIIEIGGESYFVKNIIYEHSGIVLIDDDVRTPNRCPRVRHNISVKTLPLNFSEYNINISFHFNCTGSPAFATEIPCLYNEDERKKSFVNVVNSEREELDWDVYSCDPEVVTTVLGEVFRSLSNIPTDYGKALLRGFELRWGKTEVCHKCEESDGRCGHIYNTTEFMCFCPDGTTTRDHCKGTRPNVKVKLLVIGFISAALSVVLIFITYRIMKSSSRNCVASFKHKTEEDNSVEAFFKQYGSLSTQRYKYVDIKKMTNSFHLKLGQGGFGTVYKGKLSDGRLVAVKVLNTSKASGQEFINEVASIGRTSHVNVVTLLGFCFESKKRALVYELMPNGSLEKFIHSHGSTCNTSERIRVDKLFDIALGIAQGLDYLHRGCNTRILHLDIKPHNILLDEDFCPKIADFGLAKLYSRKESIVSMLEARGTIGYIAPEVFNRNFGGVSHKSDVYSYGMLVLEMVGGRTHVDAGVGSGNTSEIYFPDWIYSRLKKDEYLLDSVTTAVENDYVRKMTIVGLWCIQTDQKQRPSINEVIEMLEGTEELDVPPKPFFCSPPRSPVSTLNASESEIVSL